MGKAVVGAEFFSVGGAQGELVTEGRVKHKKQAHIFLTFSLSFGRVMNREQYTSLSGHFSVYRILEE